MLISAAVLLASLVALSVGADVLVRSASRLATRMGVSSLFIGLTVVGFGTSTPELGASLFAAARGQHDVAVANVVGSNIFNIAVILGLTAVIFPITVHWRTLKREVKWVCGAAVAPLLALTNDSTVGRLMGVGLVAALIFYLVWSYQAARQEVAAEGREPGAPTGAVGSWVADSGWVLLSLVILVVGSRFLVESATEIARWLGLSDRVIGLTIVAAGTSAPELITTLVAAFRGNADLGVGNVLGSNVFNMLGILGVTAITHPQTLAPAALSLDIPLMILASLALIPICLSAGRISRGEGLLLLAGYGGYLFVLLS